jgi:lipopolysaccharide export system protein LptA
MLTMRRSDAAMRLAAALLFAGTAAPALAQSGQQAQGQGQTSSSGFQFGGDGPIEIESDKLEVRESENKAIFTGNVSVTQGPTLLKSGTMTVFYAKDGGSAATGSSNIERLEVDGKVYVKSDRQVATGDRGTFDMKTEVLVLSGNEVVLSEGNNVLRGCKLTVQMKSGQAQVDGCTKAGGRVQMKLDPSSRQ